MGKEIYTLSSQGGDLRLDRYKELTGRLSVVQKFRTIMEKENSTSIYLAVAWYSLSNILITSRVTPAWSCDYSVAQAKQKAISEAYERFSLSNVPRNLIKGTKKSLNEALSPNSFLAYDQHDELNKREFIDGEVRLWANVRSFRGQRKKLMLADLLFGPMVGKETRDGVHTDATSSGWAAHLDFKQAAINAVSELVERDALMRFWHGGGPVFNLCKEAKSMLGQLPVQATLWLMPSMALNVVLAIASTDRDGIVCGMGASKDLHDAMEKALLEVFASTRAVAQNNKQIINQSEICEAFDHSLYYSDKGEIVLSRLSQCQVSHLSLMPAKIPLESIREDSWYYETSSCGDLNRVAVRAFNSRLIPIYFGNRIPNGHSEFKKLMKSSKFQEMYVHPLG